MISLYKWIIQLKKKKHTHNHPEGFLPGGRFGASAGTCWYGKEIDNWQVSWKFIKITNLWNSLMSKRKVHLGQVCEFCVTFQEHYKV